MHNALMKTDYLAFCVIIQMSEVQMTNLKNKQYYFPKITSGLLVYNVYYINIDILSIKTKVVPPLTVLSLLIYNP